MINEIKYLKAIGAFLAGRVIDFSPDTGYIPGGVNGPYFDLETPVRNSSHALILFSFLYRHTKEIEYLSQAQKLKNFLNNPKLFSENGVYIHRQKAGKDWCNGVIGQAWVVESLNIASSLLEDEELHQAAHQAAASFSFDRSVKAWAAYDPGSKSRKIDYTLNHQLWYAASISELNDSRYVDEVVQFLDHLVAFGFQTRNDGLVNHQFYAKSTKSWALRTRYEFAYKRKLQAASQKEIGYHLYNLYPLARLFKILPSHPLFSTDKFLSAIRYAQSDGFLEALQRNKYAFPYNSPTFEFPLILKTFSSLFQNDRITAIENFIWSETNLFALDESGNHFTLEVDEVDDPITLTTRAYELVPALL